MQQRYGTILTALLAAHDIQKKLQPVAFPESTMYEVAGIQIPCKEVGGDYYDVVELPNNRLGLLVADVAGKGVGGSLIMSNLQGSFRQVAGQTPSPADVIQRLNGVVKSAASIRHFFVTAFYGILDPREMSLVYCNAGHGSPLVCAPDGQVRMLEGGEVPLGILVDNRWSHRRIQLGSGDILCLYTDGISEAGGGDSDEMFGDEGVKTCLIENRHAGARSICDYILAACGRYADRQEFDDDWTLLVVKMTGPDSKRA